MKNSRKEQSEDFKKIIAMLNGAEKVQRYAAALNAAEIAPNGDDYNAVVDMLNGADYRDPHKKGR